MHLKPIQKVLAARSGSALGVMVQSTHYNTDSYDLLQGASAVEKAGIFFEPNTRTLMLEPVASPRDLGLSDVTTSALTASGTPGTWREVTNRATGAASLSQVNGNTDIEFSFETTDAAFLPANAEFAVGLNLWPCPKGASHDRDSYFRHLYFPANAPAGEIIYRAAIHYGEEPRLEYTTDGATAAFVSRTAYWVEVGTIPSAVDLSALRQGKNVEVTFTFMQLDGKIVAWCGNDLSRFTLAIPTDSSTIAGSLRFEGKNGQAQVDFADLVHKHYGYYVSYPQYGPANMKDVKPTFVVQPALSQSGHRVTGQIERINDGTKEFQYRLTLQATNRGDGYATSSPIVKQVTVAWPPIWKPPQSGGWSEVRGVNRIEEYQSFDLQSGIASTRFAIELENSLARTTAAGGSHRRARPHGLRAHGLLSARGCARANEQSVDGERGGKLLYLPVAGFALRHQGSDALRRRVSGALVRVHDGAVSPGARRDCARHPQLHSAVPTGAVSELRPHGSRSARRLEERNEHPLLPDGTPRYYRRLAGTGRTRRLPLRAVLLRGSPSSRAHLS
jgi:hypothetical protein